MNTHPKEPPPRIQSAEAAAMLGVSVRTVQLRAAAGEIPGAALIFGRWTFDRKKLLQFIEGRERVAARLPASAYAEKHTSADDNARYEAVYASIVGRKRRKPSPS